MKANLKLSIVIRVEKDTSYEKNQRVAKVTRNENWPDIAEFDMTCIAEVEGETHAEKVALDIVYNEKDGISIDDLEEVKIEDPRNKNTIVSFKEPIIYVNMSKIFEECHFKLSVNRVTKERLKEKKFFSITLSALNADTIVINLLVGFGGKWFKILHATSENESKKLFEYDPGDGSDPFIDGEFKKSLSYVDGIFNN